MEEQVPSEFYLSQNYPNPFRDITAIKYCLPIKANVKIIVLNMAGEQVLELLNEVCDAGTYEYIFDERNLGGGIYNYQLIVTDLKINTLQLYAETKKMILL